MEVPCKRFIVRNVKKLSTKAKQYQERVGGARRVMPPPPTSHPYFFFQLLIVQMVKGQPSQDLISPWKKFTDFNPKLITSKIIMQKIKIAVLFLIYPIHGKFRMRKRYKFWGATGCRSDEN
jgi:hypothetical protein